MARDVHSRNPDAVLGREDLVGRILNWINCEAICAVGATTHAVWTHADDRTLRHRDGSCIIAARADLVVVGDCQAATLDERTWFLGRPLPR